MIKKIHSEFQHLTYLETLTTHSICKLGMDYMSILCKMHLSPNLHNAQFIERKQVIKKHLKTNFLLRVKGKKTHFKRHIFSNTYELEKNQIMSFYYNALIFSLNISRQSEYGKSIYLQNKQQLKSLKMFHQVPQDINLTSIVNSILYIFHYRNSCKPSLSYPQ